MSEETQQEESKPAGRAVIPLALAVLVGIAVGGGAGAFVAGPLLAKRVVASMNLVAATAEAQQAGGGEAGPGEDAEEGGEGHGEEGAATAAVVHKIENLVVNPAGTGGSRFLILSLALAPKDDAQIALLEGMDVQVRDAVIGVLGRKGIVELASMEARPALKQEVMTAVDSLFGKPTLKAVYFPTYVIQ